MNERNERCDRVAMKKNYVGHKAGRGGRREKERKREERKKENVS